MFGLFKKKKQQTKALILDTRKKRNLYLMARRHLMRLPKKDKERENNRSLSWAMKRAWQVHSMPV